jgi:hypothetical protein
MDNTLARIIRAKDILYQRKVYIPEDKKLAPIINITGISAISIYYNLKRPKNKIFSTSLYKIN